MKPSDEQRQFNNNIKHFETGLLNAKSTLPKTHITLQVPLH